MKQNKNDMLVNDRLPPLKKERDRVRSQQHNIAEIIKRKVQLSELLSDYGVKDIKRSGGINEYICLCPFHQDKQPSFSFNVVKGVYNCFACGAKGNLFSFIMQIEGMSFRQALQKLAAKAGLNIKNIKGRNYE